MELVIIFGPPAVGKMSVGMELEKLTGYKLFHNHMTIELVHHFFDFGQGPFWKLVAEFRNRLFEEIGTSGLPGLIFTYVWALDQEDDTRTVEGYCASLGVPVSKVLFVELEADQATRLVRNKTELRLKHKRSKNNLEGSEKALLAADVDYRLNSHGDFPFPGNHLKINNQNLTPGQAARLIVERLASGSPTRQPPG